jgi:3'-phosphoadenosine 5'-phosphosulfate (PAPS) 3'-phosphatase
VTVNGKLWDCVAPAAIVLEAGGQIVDLQGNAIFPYRLTNYEGARVPFVSTAPGAHDQLIREIRTYA